MSALPPSDLPPQPSDGSGPPGDADTAARFRELHDVAALLVPAHGESLYVLSHRAPGLWLRHHDRTREARLRTLLRDPGSRHHADLERILETAEPGAGPTLAAASEDDPELRDALRRLEAEVAVVVRWHDEDEPPTGLILLRRPGREHPGSETLAAVRSAEEILELPEPGRTPPAASTEARTLARIVDEVDRALLLVDGEGVLQLCNRAAETLLSWTRGSRLGTPLDALEVATVGGDPQDAARVVEDAREGPRDCLVLGGEEAWIPVRLRARHLVGGGGPDRTLVSLERLRQEDRETKRSGGWDRPLRDLILASPVPTVALDAEGRVRLWSPAAERVFGWSAGEVLGGRHPLDTPGDEAGLLEQMERALVRRPFAQIETDLVRSDGTALRVVASGSPMRDADGNRAGTLLSVVDVTHTHRLEEQIQAAQRMQAVAELAGGVAHDFNNLLTRITGLSEIVQISLDEGHPAHGSVLEIEATAMEAAGIANQLMAFSRQRMIRFERLDLAEALADLRPALSQTVGGDVEVELRVPDEQVVIRGDRAQVQQAVLNLAANARDAMPRGGRLEIVLGDRTLGAEDARELSLPADPGDYAHVSVRDDGVGMDEATLARIFEPFFSTRKRGHRLEPGQGLGLSATYGVVKQMGGFIWVESEPGEGTTFHLLFPEEVGETVSAAEGSATPGEQGGTETILLVEDDPQVLRLLEQTLKQRGYQVLCAHGGLEALGISRLRAGGVDLLVTDVLMPRMRGPELARRLRGDDPDLPVLFITGYADDPELRTGLLEDDQAILEKPFRPRELAGAVRRLLDATARADVEGAARSG